MGVFFLGVCDMLTVIPWTALGLLDPIPPAKMALLEPIFPTKLSIQM